MLEDSIVAIQVADQATDFSNQLESTLTPNIDAFVKKLQPLILERDSLDNLNIKNDKNKELK